MQLDKVRGECGGEGRRITMKSKLPPAKFREWAFELLHIETLADAACYVQEGGGTQRDLLRQLVRATRSLRECFVRQAAKEAPKKGSVP